MALAAIPVAPAPFLMRGTARQFAVPSCVFELNDLRRLFRLLEQKAVEAADHQVATLVQQPGQSPAQFTELQTTVRSSLALVIRLQTPSEWISGTTIELLGDEQLPDGVIKIEFDSAFLYRSRFNNAVPNNSFLVALDFTRTGILDLNALPQQSNSVANILGLDATWANAVHDELAGFFRQRRSKRGWLHLSRSYDALLIPIGFPLSFDIVYHLDHTIRRFASLPEALSVALYVYIVLVVLLLFRTVFNYARWAFPKLELDAPRQHVARGHRVAITTLALMVLGVLVKAGLRLLGIG